MAATNSVYLTLMISLLLLPSVLSQDLALVHSEEGGEASLTSGKGGLWLVNTGHVTYILASDWSILVT